MILRVLAVAAGLAGAGTLSQFPEFSQQYVQRLGGAVDGRVGLSGSCHRGRSRDRPRAGGGAPAR